MREGGSVPVCASFESILGLSTVLLGFAPPDGQFHAPNEWMSMANYETGIRAIARFWDEAGGARDSSLSTTSRRPRLGDGELPAGGTAR